MNYSKQIVNALRSGGIGIFATDTIYGIHTSTLRPDAVEKIYQIRGRDESKPFIVLISSITDLSVFKIALDEQTKAILEKYWPGKVSVILPCKEPVFEYIHRGKNSIAFRIPDKPELLELLRQTGPLVSTSVNPEGKTPAKTIEEAKAYFGNKIDFYIDEGQLESPPSTVIKIENGKITVLREGAVKINGSH